VSFFLGSFTIYSWLVVKQRDELERELEKAVQLARNEQAKSDAVIAAIADGISIQDLEFRVLHQNAAHQAIAGGDRRGEYCYKAYVCGETICATCPLADALLDGQVHRIEKPGPPGSGVDFIEITASPIRNANGEIVGGLEIVRDISEQKWAVEAIKQQTLFLQRLIDTIPSPIFYKNPLGIFLGCNAAFAACIGRSQEEVIGRTLYELMPHEFAKIYAVKDNELFADPGVQIYESFVHCQASGEPREVIFNKATFTDQYGEIAGLVGVVIDIADHVAAERAINALNQDLSRQASELAAANRELEAYNYSFTHDLRNNLTRISSGSQILVDIHSDQLDEHGKMLLQGIITAVDQIQELSEAMQLLFLVTRRDILHEPVNLSEMATAIVMDLRLADLERQVTFSIQPDLLVIADPRLMRVLLKNLLDNAWKYSGKRAESLIDFGLQYDGAESCFYVRDNGVGFPSAKAEQLFLPFKRLHHPSDFPGSGIGLATVQRIIQRHGGRVWAEGAVDQGATFLFSLPADAVINLESAEKGQP
jgi:PAS domain S-box-containing protein